jgi:hypothetical protein
MVKKEKPDIDSQLSCLIKDIENDSFKLSTLLLKTKSIAKKLRLEDLNCFIKNELEGKYINENLPKYRIRLASPVGLYKNGYNGQIQKVPLNMEVLRKQYQFESDFFYKQFITQSVIEIEDHIEKNKLSEIRIKFTPAQLNLAKECSSEPNPWFLFDAYYQMSLSVFPAILANIRNTLLDHLIEADEQFSSSLEINQQLFLKGKPFDALVAFLDILRSANKSVVLIDNYVNDKTLNFFSDVDKSVTVLIITQPKSKSPSFDNLLDSFSKQYRSIEIRTTSDFHDRFIIIDNRDYYNLGASIKDAGNKVFMFSKINDLKLQQTIDEIVKKLLYPTNKTI